MSELNDQCLNCGYRYSSKTWKEQQAEIERLRAELAAVDLAFDPVRDWYDAQGRLDRAAMLRDAVEDLQRDRSDAIKLSQLEHALDAALQLAHERDEAREAAKACFHEVVIRLPRDRSLTVGGLLERWPWLEE